MSNAKTPDRTFLYQCLAALGLLIAASLYAKAFPMNIMSPEYPMWSHARASAETPSKRKLDVLILGDSRAKAGLVPEILSPNAQSLTLGGATPIELRWLLRADLENHPPPRRLVISLTPGHLIHAEAFWERSVKFGLLSPAEVDGLLDRERLLRDDVLSEPLATRWEANLYRWGLAPIYYGGYLASLGFLRRGKNHAVLAQLEHDRGRYHFGTASSALLPSEEADWTSFAPSPLLVEEFDALLAEASALPCEVAFVLAPISERTATQLDPRFLGDFAEFMDTRAQRYPSVAIETVQPIYRDDAFGDPSHLGPEAAKSFSRAVSRNLGQALAGLELPTRLGEANLAADANR